MKDLALAFGELFIATKFYDFIKKIETGELKTNKDTKECLNLLFQLHCLTRIEMDLGTFRDGDYLTSEHGDMIKAGILRILGEVKRHIIPLVETFYPGEELMDSMLAPANGDLYGAIVNKIYTAPNAFERIKNWQSIYKKEV